MNFDNFKEALGLVCSMFPGPNEEKKLRALYYFCGKETYQTIEKAAEEYTRREHKFPVWDSFRPYVYANIPKNDDLRVPCPDCRTVGVIYTKDGAAQCGCMNGKLYYPSLPVHPAKRTDWNVEEIVKFICDMGPMKFARGMMECRSMTAYREHPMYQKVRALVADLLGKDRIKELTAKPTTLGLKSG